MTLVKASAMILVFLVSAFVSTCDLKQNRGLFTCQWDQLCQSPSFFTAPSRALNPEPNCPYFLPHPMTARITLAVPRPVCISGLDFTHSLPHSLSPPIHDAVAQAVPMALQMGDGECWQASDGKALVFPCQNVFSQVYLLVHHGKLHLWELAGNNLRERQSCLGGRASHCAIPPCTAQPNQTQYFYMVNILPPVRCHRCYQNVVLASLQKSRGSFLQAASHNKALWKTQQT